MRDHHPELGGEVLWSVVKFWRSEKSGRAPLLLSLRNSGTLFPNREHRSHLGEK